MASSPVAPPPPEDGPPSGSTEAAATEIVDGCRAAYREVFLTFGLVGALSLLVATAGQLLHLLDYVPVLLALLFVGAAIRRVGRHQEQLARYGIALGGLLAPPEDTENSGPLGLFDLLRLMRQGMLPALREILFATLVALVVFPPFLLAYRFWFGVDGWPAWRPPDDLLTFAVAQVLVVALPEEVFFRGYVQTRLSRRDGPAIQFGPLVLQSLLFALVHLIDGRGPARLAVFFPGLLFGCMRSWRGGVGAAIVFHAMCNLYAELLFRGWLLQ